MPVSESMAERARARAAREYDEAQARQAQSKGKVELPKRAAAMPLAGVPKYKARVRGERGELKLSRDLLAKVEYEPQNEHAAGESLGFQSCKLASYALYLGQFEHAAKLMVQEHLDLKLGITKLTALISWSML